MTSLISYLSGHLSGHMSYHMGSFIGLALPGGWAETLLSSALAFAVPLVLAGVGECVCERGGVLNIGLEGMMLSAAFLAVLASHATGSPWLGVAAAVAGAIILGSVFGWLVIHRAANQVVVGTAINLLALGLTGVWFGVASARLAVTGAQLRGIRLPDWSIPVLADLPVVGPTLFRANILLYVAALVVPLSAFVLTRTRLGLQLRAAGEHPVATEAAGSSVVALRWGGVLVGAALAGLAGAFLAIGHVASFADNMTAGKGFIALSLVIFGRWNPWGVLAGAAVFSLAVGCANVLGTQGRGRPEEVLLLALPYAATLMALLLRTGRRGGPAALGRPLERT